MDAEVPDVDALLARVGFDAADSVLTRRQAEVLALRERGVPQAAIADSLGTSRANISKVESSARANVRKSRETVAFADALEAPVHVEVESGTDLYDVPDAVFAAGDDANVKVPLSAPEVMKRVSDVGEDAVTDREVRTRLLVTVTADGELRVRVAPEGDETRPSDGETHPNDDRTRTNDDETRTDGGPPESQGDGSRSA